MTAASIILPAYNEERGIGSVLDKIKDVMTASGIVYEIIVVDDGSTDETVEVAQARGVRTLQHSVNKGYGAAIKTGIRNARHDLVAIIDADGTYPCEVIPKLVSYMDSCDMVVGARTGGSVAIPLIRRPVKWAIGWLANLVAGEPIPDINSGLRVFRRQVVLRFFNMLPDGFSFTTTLTLAMLSNGYLVRYMPINYQPRVGRSKIRPIQDTLNFVQLILRIALYFAPLKIFLPLTGILLLLAVAWGLFSWWVMGRLADVSTLVIVMTGIQVAVIGMLAELINHRLPNYYYREARRHSGMEGDRQPNKKELT